MDRLNRLLRPRAPSYEPLPDHNPQDPTQDGTPDGDDGGVSGKEMETLTFEYVVFAVLGVAMLWSWNMFMACATYFQRRFASSPFILHNFQSLILLVSCVPNLLSVIFLSTPASQRNADYPGRILQSLKLSAVAFTLLALSTLIWREAGPVTYLMFTLCMVFLSSLASGMMQNGAFSWVNRFPSINTQALMVGQSIAGVLPGIAQIMSILLFPPPDTDDKLQAEELPTISPLSAFFYFITATLVSMIAFIGTAALKRRHRSTPGASVNTEDNSVPFFVLQHKLGYLAFTVFFTFTVTMIFPVFTQAIVSVRPIEDQSRFFQPDVFIPLSFVIWNIGDLVGRVLCAYPYFRVSRPKLLAFLSVCRLIFIPLYLICNIKDQGSLFNSDAMYWLIQIAFGMSNGWLGSNSLMTAPVIVEDSEKEAAGGFMTVWLVGGLTSGSILSFFVM